MEPKCFECDQPAHHDHHVVPRVLGGTKTLPLCETCHGRVHGCKWKDHGSLVRAGLARARARGVKLGNLQALRKVRGQGAAATSRAAAAFAKTMLPMIKGYQAQGMNLRDIANALNERKVPTRTEHGRWTATQLSRIQRRGGSA